MFSSGTASTTSHNWDKRTLKVGLFAANQTPSEVDSAESAYVVLAGKRKLDDDPSSPD